MPTTLESIGLYGNVAELDGRGRIMVRYLDDFLKGDRLWRCGQKIYATYDTMLGLAAKWSNRIYRP